MTEPDSSMASADTDLAAGADSGNRPDTASAAEPAPTRRWYRRRRVVLGAALLVVLVAAGAAITVLNQASSPAVGTLLPASRSEITGTEVQFDLPSGGVSFTIADPVEEVAEDAGVPAKREAGEATSLLGIAWSVQFRARAFLLYGIAVDEGITASAALVVDGDRIELGDMWDLGVRPPPQEGFLVVPGAPDQLSVEDIVLEVAYDGLVQSINIGSGEGDRGVAAAYGDTGQLPGATAYPACPEPADSSGAEGLVTTGTCSLEYAIGTPYFGDLGWAEPGTTWVLVELSARVEIEFRLGPGARDDVVRYELTSASQQFTLGGVPATSVLSQVFEYDDTAVTTVVFGVPADEPSGELAISGVYGGSADDARYSGPGGYPETISVPFDLAFTMPELI
ncbi:MAG: hypothetical protein WKF72_03160 [Nocardioidaceae bacterium]